jgi:hypothetical protein
MKLHNSGNVHGVPFGNVFIMKGNKTVATLMMNGERGNMLPNSKRIYQTEWTSGFPVYKPIEENGKVKLDAKGQQVRKLHWDFSKLADMRFGKYTASLFVIYDDGQRDIPIESTLTFWVIPWRFLLVVLLVITLVGFGFYFSLRGTWRGLRRLGGGKRRR